MVKNTPAKAGDAGDVHPIPRSGGSPEVRYGNLLQYSCLENPHGQRNLVGYSPGGCIELDTTDGAQHLPHHDMVVGNGFWFMEIS